MKYFANVLVLTGLLSVCKKPVEEVFTPAVKFDLNSQTTYQTITAFGGINRMWGSLISNSL